MAVKVLDDLRFKGSVEIPKSSQLSSQIQDPGELLTTTPAPPTPSPSLPSLLLSQTHPSEPGLEGVLSDEREETDATDRGRDEEGMVKDRTMDRGRLPLLSSRLEGWIGAEGREREWLAWCPCQKMSSLAWSDTSDQVVLAAWSLYQSNPHFYEQLMFLSKAEGENHGYLEIFWNMIWYCEKYQKELSCWFSFFFFNLKCSFLYQDHNALPCSKVSTMHWSPRNCNLQNIPRMWLKDFARCLD